MKRLLAYLLIFCCATAQAGPFSIAGQVTASPVFTGTPILGSVEDNITAFAGGGQASATQLSSTAMYHRVTTVATSADSVKLPAATAGAAHFVENSNSISLAVFPNTGDTINGGAANAVGQLIQRVGSWFICITAGNWSQLTGSRVFGTTNQVVVAIAASGTATLSLPQSIDTAAAVQFGSLGLGVAAGSAGTLGASGAVTLPGLATSSAATTGTMCWTTGTGNVNVDTTTTCLLSGSQFKEHDRPLDSGLDTVMALQPKAYFLRPEFNPTGLGEQIGLFAQDVAAVDDRLTSFEATGEPHAVRYQQLTAVLVKAIQEQQALLEKLQARIDDLIGMKYTALVK